MTKKDYKAIARVFLSHSECGEDCSRLTLINDVANVMEADNPRFRREEFLAACRGDDFRNPAGRTVRYSVEK